MKIKIILISFLVIFMVLFIKAFAYGDHIECENVDRFCHYQGMFRNIDGAEEEFQMLLEPIKHPNFQWMFQTTMYIFANACDSDNTKCLEIVRNSNCNVAKYTKKLFRFYEAHKEKIKENIRTGSDDLKLLNVFDHAKEIIGEEFLREKEDSGVNSEPSVQQELR